MSILRIIGKHAGQYILSVIVISLFVSQSFRPAMLTISGALIAISLFATSFSMILGEYGGNVCSSIATWSTRIMIFLVVVMSAYGIGISKILKLF